jgi:hypothetical protein
VSGESLVIGGQEALRVHGRLVGVLRGGQSGERHAATFARSAAQSHVREDAEDPGLERRAPLEAVEALQDPEPRLLHDLLGDVARLNVVARHRQHRAVVSLDERLEGLLVAGAQARQELGLLRGRGAPVLVFLDLAHESETDAYPFVISS